MNAREPKPDPGIPRPPEHLSERARTAWPRVARLLRDMGVLGKADGMALEGLCETYAELVQARVDLASRDSTTYTSPSGLIKSYPEVARINELDRRFAMWLAKVGLTPADRSRVSALGGTEKEADPWSQFPAA